MRRRCTPIRTLHRSDSLSVNMAAVWLSNNAFVSVNVVARRRARLVLEWVTASIPSTNSQSSRPTQPGHPSVGRSNEHLRRPRPSLGKKRRVLRHSNPCVYDCKCTSSVCYVCWLNTMDNSRRLKKAQRKEIGSSPTGSKKPGG